MKQNDSYSAQPELDFYYSHNDYVIRHTYQTHCHNAYEFIFFISGSATYLTEGCKYNLQKHDLVITKPARYHSVDVRDDKKYNRINILVNSAPDLTALLDSLPSKFEVVNCENIPEIINCFSKTDLYNSRLPKKDFNLLLNNLLTEVCYNLLIHDSVVEQEHNQASQTILDALNYINAHLFEITDIKEVCDRVFISEAHFFRLFKQELKISPKKYITSKRLLYAQTLLAEGEKPTAIFERCGFNNYISFYQRYVDFFGYPPSDEPSKKK